MTSQSKRLIPIRSFREDVPMQKFFFTFPSHASQRTRFLSKNQLRAATRGPHASFADAHPNRHTSATYTLTSRHTFKNVKTTKHTIRHIASLVQTVPRHGKPYRAIQADSICVRVQAVGYLKPSRSHAQPSLTGRLMKRLL